MSYVGLKLKEIRLKNGLLQKRVAELCGMHPSIISTIEKGRVSPRFTTIQKLAHGLNEKINIFYEDSPSIPPVVILFNRLNSKDKKRIISILRKIIR